MDRSNPHAAARSDRTCPSPDSNPDPRRCKLLRILEPLTGAGLRASQDLLLSRSEANRRKPIFDLAALFLVLPNIEYTHATANI